MYVCMYVCNNMFLCMGYRMLITAPFPCLFLFLSLLFSRRKGTFLTNLFNSVDALLIQLDLPLGVIADNTRLHTFNLTDSSRGLEDDWLALCFFFSRLLENSPLAFFFFSFFFSVNSRKNNKERKKSR